MDQNLIYNLQSYYAEDPTLFMSLYNGTTYYGKFYKAMSALISTYILSIYKSYSSSVIQLDMSGNIILSDNSISFAQNKDEIKRIPGSVEKLGDQIFIGGGKNKYAYIFSASASSFTNVILNAYFPYNSRTSDQIDFVNDVFGGSSTSVSVLSPVWSYKSKRNVTSFHLAKTNIQDVYIRDDSVEDNLFSIRQNTTIKWNNVSSKPVSVYSGSTDYDTFQLNPDLSIYGTEFKSTIIQPGESWSYKFVTAGEYDWFIYPDILSGKIIVSKPEMNADDEFYIVENDSLLSPQSSRVIRVDSWGNVVWSFGESYLTKPRRAMPMFNNNVLIST